MSGTLIDGLVASRANTWEQIKELLESAEQAGRGLDAEAEQSYQRMNADLGDLDQRIQELVDAERRQADIDASLTEIGQRRGEVRTATDTDEIVNQFRGIQSGEVRSFEARASKEELRALGKASASTGGATVPTSFAGALYAHLIETATVAGISTVFNTDSGETFDVPVTTAHSSASLTTEGNPITPSDPVFAKRSLGAFKFATLIKVPNELLTDTGVDLEGYLAMQAGRACGNALGAGLAVGTGGGTQPSGLIPGATTGVTGASGVGGAFVADELIDLYHSVIAPYRNSPSCGWLMKDATLARVRKLKDNTNQYLWQPSLQVGAPDTLLGKPVHTDPNIAGVALGAKSVAFGDFSAYWTRLVGGVRFERSDEFAFDSDVVTFRAIVRGDGLMVDQTGAVKVFVGNAA